MQTFIKSGPLSLAALAVTFLASIAMAQTAPPANAANNPAVAAVYWPTGQRSTSVMLLEKFSPNPVWLNKPYEYQLRVTNISSQTLNNVVLLEKLADGYKLNGTNPKAQQLPDGRLQWPLGNMAPGSNHVVRLHGVATRLGKLENCMSVHYDLNACMQIEVVQPEIKLTKTAPQEVMLCDPINMQLTVSNTGSGNAENVVIIDKLPDGLVTLDGQRAVQINVGSLPAGTSRQANLSVKAQRTGTFTNNATANADGGLTANASSTTKVVAPKLVVTKTGPDMRFAGRPIQYTLTVQNTGDGMARNATLVDQVPVGLKFLKASDNGQLANNLITWQLGDLKPNEKREVSTVLVGTQLGEVENVAQASAYCADDALAKIRTKVAGIPAILLEVVDEVDPVEVGQTTTYMIRVTNQGSLAGTNIVIKCELEDEMEYVSASGSTNANAAGKTITMSPVPSLAPKQQAVWKVVIKAVASGDVRFGVQMTSDQIDRPVLETEATNFYQ